MKVSELGEFRLIERLAELLAAEGSPELSQRLLVGIGDDAAVWRFERGALIATTDTLVEGVHFLPKKTSWADLGWKALAVNVSDIAAMGGEPQFALITIAVPKDAEAEDLDELYRGVAEASNAFGIAVAGGDVVRSENFFVSVAAAGRAGMDRSGQPRLLRRNEANAGDVIAVTGSLGGAAGGLRLLREDRQDETARPLIERHLRPRPRVREGLAAVAAGVRCGIDVSDGLLQDLGHVCRASGLGAVVWQDSLPVDPALAGHFEPAEAIGLAASGGEDYELLVTGSRDVIDAFVKRCETPVTVIGEMVIAPEHVATLLDGSGRPIELASAGWDHLRDG